MSNRVHKPVAGEVRMMLKMLREQAEKIFAELSMLEVRAQLADQTEEFMDAQIRDRLTDLSLSVQNLDGEVTAIWKRTR